MQIHCERLCTTKIQAFSDLYSIYTEAIPERERKSREQLEALVERNDYRFLLLMEGDEAIGFSTIFAPKGKPFCLLEYMAIKHARRGQGLGGELFSRSMKECFSEPHRTHCLLEVDSPRPGSLDFETARLRQQFYRKQGCLAIEGLDYTLPLPGKNPPPAMELMVLFWTPHISVNASELGAWLRTLYVDVYECPADDPRIQEMLDKTDLPARLI